MTGKQKSFLTHFRRQGGTLSDAEAFLQTHEPTEEMLKSLDKYYEITTPKRKIKQLISLFASEKVKSYLRKQETRGKLKKVNGISVEERKKRQKKLLECEKPDKKRERTGPGRKTRYDRSQDVVVKKLYALGATDEEVWTTLGIGRSTYYDWRMRHQSFEDCIYIGKDFYNTQQAEASLSKKVTGYSETYKEVELDGNKVVKKVQIKTKVFAPDTNAIKYYLNNRKKERWSDRPGETDVNQDHPEIELDRQAHLDGVEKSDQDLFDAQKLLDELTDL